MIARRTFLASASLLALAGPVLGRPLRLAAIKAEPVPLSAVRLTPSIYAQAVDRNRRTLLELEPDRLLDNFDRTAGLPPKRLLYGGW